MGVVLEEDDRQKPENIWRPGPSKELSILFQSKLIMQAGGKDGVERLREWNMAQVRITRRRAKPTKVQSRLRRQTVSQAIL